MKILLVSLFLPHPDASHAGGRFVFELLRHLSHSHQVTLVTRHESDEGVLLNDLNPFCSNIYPYSYRSASQRGVQDNLKLIANYLGFSLFANRLIKDGNYDLVQVEWVEAGVLIKRHKTPMILDAHDVISKPFKRIAEQTSGIAGGIAALKALVVRVLEVQIMQRFNSIITRSEYDCNFLKQLWPQAPATIISHPAGLDITDKNYERKPESILFLASYKYRQVNVDAALWFYRVVFPQIKERVPDATFTIAGYGPPLELTELESDPAVRVPGFVDDIDRCYKEAAVFVAPILTGGGIIVKVLDALASGTPTVSTTYGNEGVSAIDGRDILVADEPDKFADAVVRLLSNKSLAASIGASGRSFIQANYGRDAIMARHDALVSELSDGK
ncbi:MAG: glycosyltransferase [Geobacteraceae bacterium]|nr:glycosyltransferase [Geobacteraceae bacterium]